MPRVTEYFPLGSETDIDEAIAALEAIRDEHAADGTRLVLMTQRLPQNGNQPTIAVRLRRRDP